MNACAHTRTVQELKELTKAETVLAKETLSLGERVLTNAETSKRAIKTMAFAPPGASDEFRQQLLVGGEFSEVLLLDASRGAKQASTLARLHCAWGGPRARAPPAACRRSTLPPQMPPPHAAAARQRCMPPPHATAACCRRRVSELLRDARYHLRSWQTAPS